MDFVLAVAITEAKDAANLKSLNLTNLDLSQVNKAIDLNAIAAKKSAQERFQKDFSFLPSVYCCLENITLKTFQSAWENI